MLHKNIQRMKMAKGLEPEPPDAGDRSPRKVWAKCKAMYMRSHDKPLVLMMVQKELEDVFPDLAETIDRLEGGGVHPDRILRKILFDEAVDVSPVPTPAEDARPRLHAASRADQTIEGIRKLHHRSIEFEARMARRKAQEERSERALSDLAEKARRGEVGFEGSRRNGRPAARHAAPLETLTDNDILFGSVAR